MYSGYTALVEPLPLLTRFRNKNGWQAGNRPKGYITREK